MECRRRTGAGVTHGFRSQGHPFPSFLPLCSLVFITVCEDREATCVRCRKACWVSGRSLVNGSGARQSLVSFSLFVVPLPASGGFLSLCPHSLASCSIPQIRVIKWEGA